MGRRGTGHGQRSAEGVAAGESGTASFLNTPFWPEEGRGQQTQPCLLGPEPRLLGQFADDSDEGTVFILQPLVIRFQFC